MAQVSISIHLGGGRFVEAYTTEGGYEDEQIEEIEDQLQDWVVANDLVGKVRIGSCS